MTHLQNLQQSIQPLQRQLVEHPLYSALQTLDDVRIFTEYHIYAVWDFMSLLKSLQQHCTCITIPWRPVASADVRYLINEIVLGEECDIDHEGNRTSHYELYRRAMEQLGASSAGIEAIISGLSDVNQQNMYDNIVKLIQHPAIPPAAQQFMATTFGIIQEQKPYVTAAVFTFGREDIIPEMFVELLDSLQEQHPGSTNILRYYITRHIEVDGGHHSQLACAMTEELCSNNELYWQEATEAVKTALQARIALWDGIYKEICGKKILNDMVSADAVSHTF